MTDSDRVASDAQLAEFVRSHLECMHCDDPAVWLKADDSSASGLTGLCERAVDDIVAGKGIRIRPKRREIATPEETWQALRNDGLIALRRMAGTTIGYRFADVALADEKNGAELLWLVDPEETQ